MPLSSNHLSAFSFPVDQAAGAALVEENPASRSEIRTGVLLRLGDDPAPPAELDEAGPRELQPNEGGKENIGVKKKRVQMAALETTATLECNVMAAYDTRFGNHEKTHMQESCDDADATCHLRECETFLLPSTLDTCVHTASSCFPETVKANPRCNEILCYHAYLTCES